jgi:hypothetical protein
MWYHYVVALVAVYYIVSSMYSQITGYYPSLVSRLPSLVGVVLCYFAFKWAYNGIYPPSMLSFGSGRRY